jgi:hypothetical protein
MARKLSDILIEIAMQGLKSTKYGHSEVMHPLMLLSHVAWNRDTKLPDYLEGRYQRELAKFHISKRKLRAELISADWSVILDRMIDYKQARFPDDKRVITLCAFTPWGSLRVEWDPETEQNNGMQADARTSRR